MIEENPDDEITRENLQDDFQLEQEQHEDNTVESKVLKRLQSTESQGSYGNDIIEDLDDAFAFTGLEEKEDDEEDHDGRLEHKESESPLTLSEAIIDEVREAPLVPHEVEHDTKVEQVISAVPVDETESSVPPVEEIPTATTETVQAPVVETTTVPIAAEEPAPTSPAPELTSPSVRSKPVRISEAKLYAKMNENKDKEPVTPAVIETGRGKENSVRSASRVFDKGFSMRTPEQPVESTDQIKNWIKSTVSGKKIQRKDIVTASHDSYDEDSGEIKRRSWSFKKTPENTPDKSQNKPTTPTSERPKSLSLTPSSSAKIKSAMKDSSMDSNSDTPSVKKHASGSKLRFADRPLPSPRTEGESSAATDGGDGGGATVAAPGSSEMSPVGFRKPSFNFSNINTTPSAAAAGAVTDRDSGSAPSTPTSSSSAAAMRLSTASDASNEDNDERDEYDDDDLLVRTTSGISLGGGLSRESSSASMQQQQQEEEARLAHLKRLRKTDSQRLQREASMTGGSVSQKETYDRTKLRTVQLETKPSKKVLEVDEDDVVVVKVVEEKKPLEIVFHPIKYLQEANLHKKFDGLWVGKLEAHLNDEDFKKHFGVKRDDYYKQPQWKQHDRKKRLGLY